jgi:uncharacterized membrane protein YhaH (DUF805 family)
MWKQALYAKYVGPLLVTQMCVAQVAIDLRNDPRGTLLLYAAIGIFAFCAWLTLLVHHLHAIQRSQLWALSFFIGQAIMAWAFYIGFSALAWTMFGAVVVIQIPFALLAPTIQPGPLNSAGSNGPSA